MSYYYNYYFGSRNKSTGEFDTYGAYDDRSSPLCILSKSRSFASDLHDDMDYIPEEKMSYRMKQFFGYKDFNGEEKIDNVKWISFNKLPDSNPIKGRYILKEELINYLNSEHDLSEDEYFTEKLTMQQYNIFAQMYLEDHKKTRKVEVYDLEKDEYVFKNVKPTDYVYYQWIDYNSKEYETWLIKTFAFYSGIDLIDYRKEDNELVLLETEG